ncbi:hypothetical protein B0H14DRAFT_2767911 [Mycena olivaceomarginata]|nr:hypothetical protein B0H14DRAFT_2767911 [Mycena olivaceomarginata]
MSSRLPPELIDRIIDFLWDSPSDLFACSLVCSQWLSSSSRYIFESLTVRADPRFLDLVQFPSSVVANYTRTLNFHLWPPQADHNASQILRCLPGVLNLRAVIVGTFPPSPKSFPVLSQVTKVSLRHTRFTSCTDFTQLVSKFTALRELKLGWVIWEGGNCGVWPRFAPGLEYLSIQGFERAPGILQWLSSADYPRTTRLALHISNNAPDPAALGIIAKFLHRLDGYLQDLRLEVYPSTYLKWTLTLLDLGSLENLQRLRIGRGIHFYPPSAPAPLGRCRVFPTVLEIALPFISRGHLKELTFDVEIVPNMLSSNSDWFLENVLTDHNKEPLPIVRFHVLRGGRSYNYEAVARHCAQFACFMRERGIGGANIVYSAEQE